MRHAIAIGRRGRPEHTTEVELAVVDTQGEVVTLRLDDGEELEMDRDELRAALEAA